MTFKYVTDARFAVKQAKYGNTDLDSLKIRCKFDYCRIALGNFLREVLTDSCFYQTGTKRGKTWNRCQALENIRQPVPSAGKHTSTGAKRGKTYVNRCQERENMQPVPFLCDGKECE